MTPEPPPAGRRRFAGAAELAAGAAALGIPVAQSRAALPLALAGTLALALLGWRRWSGARTVVALAVVASAFVYPAATVGAGLLLAVADAVALLVFLLLGGWQEAAVRASIAPRLRRADAGRVVAGTVAIGIVAVVGAAFGHADLWVAVAGMAAAVAAVLLARDAAGGE